MDISASIFSRNHIKNFGDLYEIYYNISYRHAYFLIPIPWIPLPNASRMHILCSVSHKTISLITSLYVLRSGELHGYKMAKFFVAMIWHILMIRSWDLIIIKVYHRKQTLWLIQIWGTVLLISRSVIQYQKWLK